MQRLEVSCAVRPLYGSLSIKGLMVGLARGRTNTLFYPKVQNHSQSHKACTEREANSRLKSAKFIPHSQERASVLYFIAGTGARADLYVRC